MWRRATIMVSCKVCWSVRQIDWTGVGSRIVVLLSHWRKHDTPRTYVCWLPNQICDLLRLVVCLSLADLLLPGPSCLRLTRISTDDTRILLDLTATRVRVSCPSCAALSSRVHS